MLLSMRSMILLLLVLLACCTDSMHAGRTNTRGVRGSVGASSGEGRSAATLRLLSPSSTPQKYNSTPPPLPHTFNQQPTTELSNPPLLFQHDAISGGRASEADGGLQPRKRNERRDNVAQLVPPKEGGQKKNKPLQQRRSHFAADNNDSSTDSTASSTNAGSTLTVPSLATHADSPTTVCSPRGFQRAIPSQEEARCATEGKVNSRYNNNGNSAEAKVSTQQPFTSWQQLAWISLKGSLAAQVGEWRLTPALDWMRGARDGCVSFNHFGIGKYKNR